MIAESMLLTSTSERTEFTVRVDGKDTRKDCDIFSVLVVREVNRIPFSRLLIHDGSASDNDFKVSNLSLFEPGRKVEILTGTVDKQEKVFEGIVVKLSLKVRNNGESHLMVECKDSAVKMTTGKKSRYFTEMKDSEIMEEIAGAYGLETEIEDTQEIHPEMVQYEATDWAFLCSRAESNGKVILLEDGILKVQAPQLPQTGAMLPIVKYGAGGNIVSLDADLDVRYQWTSVVGKTWNPADQQLLETEATSPVYEEPGNILASDLGEVTGFAGLELRHGGQLSNLELQQWADSHLLFSRLAKIQGRIRILGNADLKPGSLVTVEGLGDRFSGMAFVSGVRHEKGDDVWITDLQLGLASKPGQNTQGTPCPSSEQLLPSITGLQIGIVTQLQDDPLGEDRILVKAPIIDSEAEGTWARLATVDAGVGRGSFFRPEIGDEVVIGFLNNDPRDVIVLGALHSSAKPAPENFKASDDNHLKGFVTREGLHLQFDDENKTTTILAPGGRVVTIGKQGIILQNGEKSKVTIQKKKISLECNGDISIKANGGNITLEGNNVEVNAQAQFKAAGNSGAELSTSGVAVLQGSLVQIN